MESYEIPCKIIHMVQVKLDEDSECAVLDEDSECAVLDEDSECAVLDEDSECAVLDEDSECAVLDEDSECAVLDEGEESEWFKVNTGVKQGDVMSGFIFLMVVDWIMRNTTAGNKTGIRWNFTSKPGLCQRHSTRHHGTHTFNKIAIPNNKFQMASGQGSHWLIESPTIFIYE